MRLWCRSINHLKLLCMLQQRNDTWVHLTGKKKLKGKETLLKKKKDIKCNAYFSNTEANISFY